jgi:hypothetical protein
VNCIVHIADVFDENRELIATQTRRRVAGTQAALQALGDAFQQQIAHFVAQRIVHDLEPVEVEKEHGGLLLLTIGTRQCMLQSVHEKRAVRQSVSGS